MDTKIILGGVAGGILFFILGYLVWGLALMGYYEANYNQCMAKEMEDFSWWAMILSNFVWAFLLAIIFKWADVGDFIGGVKVAGIVGGDVPGTGHLEAGH